MNLPTRVMLGDIAEFINGDRGKNYPSKSGFVPSGIPFINAGHLVNGEVDFAEMNYISEDQFRKLGSGKTQQDDILYCLRGSLGKTAVVRHGGDAAIASSLVIIRPSKACCVRYIYRYLTSPLAESELRQFDNGSSQPNLSATSVKKYQVPLPPLEEQRRIAEVLDRADALRQKRRLARQKLDTLLQSVFLDMFGDPVTNPKGWKLRPLGEVAMLQRGFDLPVQDRRQGQVPIYAANGPVGSHDSYRVKGPGVVTGRSGTLGKVHYVKEDFWPLNTSLWVKNFYGNEPHWVLFLLRSMRLEQFTRGVGVPTLNRNLVHVVDVPVPPVELQQRFAVRVESIQQQIAAYSAHLAELDTLFASLQFHAFRGEINEG